MICPLIYTPYTVRKGGHQPTNLAARVRDLTRQLGKALERTARAKPCPLILPPCLTRPRKRRPAQQARRVETAWRGMSIDGVGYNLYRVRRTLHEMLKDRGYLIDQTDIDLSEEGFKEQHGEVPSREQLTILVQKRDDPTEQVYVFWPTDPKVGVKPIKR